MEKRKWNKVLSVLLVMVTALSLLSGCDGKSAEKEEEETITVYLWTTNLYEKYAPYIQEQLPDINVEFVVGNNNLDFYSISVEIKETEDGYTLSKVAKDGKEIRDTDTFMVTCLATPQHMEAYPTGKNMAFDVGEFSVKDTWIENLSDGNTVLAEPEDYLTLRWEEWS